MSTSGGWKRSCSATSAGRLAFARSRSARYSLSFTNVGGLQVSDEPMPLQKPLVNRCEAQPGARSLRRKSSAGRLAMAEASARRAGPEAFLYDADQKLLAFLGAV